MRIKNLGGCQVRRALWVAIVLGAVLSWAAGASAQVGGCQASGALPLFLGQSNLEVGDEFLVGLQIRNTSSTTPQPGVAVSAILEGTTTVNLACADSGCGLPLGGTLEFVPGPDNGCEFRAAGVDSCAVGADPNNQVDITMSPGGIALAPNAAVAMVQIRVRALKPVNQPSFFMQAATGLLDLSTADAACPVTVMGSGSTSAPLFFPADCTVELDRQVSCNGIDFVDIGFNDAVTDFCVGNGADAVTVRYRARNPGNVDLLFCELTDSNAGVLAAPFLAGNLSPADEVTLLDDADQICSAAQGGEPGTATLSCTCDPAIFPPDTAVDDTDTARFSCGGPVPTLPGWTQLLFAGLLLSSLWWFQRRLVPVG